MERLKTIVTRIKPGHKLSNNEFVRGRISGFQEALLGHVDIKTGSRAIAVHEDGSTTFSAHGTEDEIKRYKDLVVESYPNLCEFLIK